MSYKHLTDEDRDQIWRLHAQDLNADEIAKDVSRASWTVADLLRPRGGARLPSLNRTAPLEGRSVGGDRRAHKQRLANRVI